VSEGSALTRLPALRVTPVDATGAGDCFAGALLAELARGATLVDAARIANVAAALSTQGYGAVDPLPRRAQVEAALREARSDAQR
jgi:2-dehydro-3-deoxygluconokinase